MYKKLIASGVTSTMLILGVSQPVIHAEENQSYEQSDNQSDDKIKDDATKTDKDIDKLKDSIYVEGDDLSQSQRDETKKILGVKDKTTTYDININDVEEYTGTKYQFIKSSALIEPNSFYERGLDVDIVTPDNITDVSKADYINASITSGIKDAHIKIASVEPVTGEGALTGIYEGLEREGYKVDDMDAQHATSELKDLSSIDKNHEGDEEYSNDKMNNAVADMKGQVADKKHDNEKVDNAKIKAIVDETLKEKGLDNVLNDEEKSKINNIIINASNSKVMNDDPKSVSDQTSKLKNKLSDSIDKAKDKAKSESESHKGWFTSMVDTIKGWFS